MSEQRKSGDNDANEPSELAALKESVSKLKRKLDDQKQRIAALARGREDGMSAVSELRAELSLVQSERDRLRKQLTDLEGMQTETVTFDDAGLGDETDAHQGELPTIDDLMAAFTGEGDGGQASHSTLSFDADSADDSGEFQEMISPDLLVLGSKRAAVTATDERFLVLLETGKQTKCPLDQDLLTIGRSESADIKIDGDFISRIHARVLRIGVDSVLEDAKSKNGTWVNGDEIDRYVLQHGDFVRIGSANFRYVDTALGNAEDE